MQQFQHNIMLAKTTFMRHFIFLLVMITLFSCSQHDTNQKELSITEKATDTTTATVDTVKANLSEATTTQPLVLTPLQTSGDIGYVTFTQDGKTVFYYDAKSKQGKIILNGSEHTLTKIDGSYTLSGANVSITTTKGKWAPMESDCAYGKSLVATIKMGTQTLQLNNVEVQDCQGMVE